MDTSYFCQFRWPLWLRRLSQYRQARRVCSRTVLSTLMLPRIIATQFGTQHPILLGQWRMAVFPTPCPYPCYVNLQEKKKTLPLSDTSHRLTHFSLCTELSIGTPCQRLQASRLNHLLFEVMAIATPQVAYSFVPKRCPALHTFNRAGRGAGTRRETKSQLARCSYLSEKSSIR